MSITDGDGAAVSHRAQNAYGFVSRPVQYASLFYTTYWLSEIKGVADAGFDFAQLRNRSHRSFQDYGIYSVVGEISHLYQAFSVNGKFLMDVRIEDDDDFLDEFIDSMGHAAMGVELADEEAALARDMLRSSEGVRRIASQPKNRATFVKTANVAETRWSAFSEPRLFLNTCRKLFVVGYSKELDTGWSTNYGGPSWSGICAHLLRADTLPKTSWVDTSWGIQHNNSNWLDKTEPAVDEVMHLERLVDFPKIQTPRVWVYRTMLRAVLDWNQAGDWANLYPLAVTYDEHVGVNLRRFARAFDIDLPAGDQGIIHTSVTGAIEGVGESAPAEDATYVLGRISDTDTDGNLVDDDALDRAEELFRLELLERVAGHGDIVAVPHDAEVSIKTPVADIPKIPIEIDVVRIEGKTFKPKPSNHGYVTDDTTVELKRGADLTPNEVPMEALE